MHLLIQVIILVLIARNRYECFGDVSDSNDSYKWPTIGISVLVRNKEHTLPYFFSCIRQLDYPKDRLYIWIYTDNNEDDSVDILDYFVNWYDHWNNRFYVVKNGNGPEYDDENSTHWSPKHFENVITARELGLKFARNMWADYMFMVDADVYLTNPKTLKILVKKKLDVVAPMLVSDGTYSNFWCGMTDKYYYKSTSEYKQILNGTKRGCFVVPMVHTAVLYDLRTKRSDLLTYNPDKAKNYSGPYDDIITFAINARNNDFKLHICNDDFYGYVQVPLRDGDEMADDREQLVNIKMEAIRRRNPIYLDMSLNLLWSEPKRTTMGLDEIYMINLERRKERRYLMEMSFKELALKVNVFKGYDGRFIYVADLAKQSIRMLPNYEDPYHKRPMKAGEVGCFLSHYHIWQEAFERGYRATLVLEDDIHFVPYFKRRLRTLLHELEGLDWDFVYLGRKVLQDGEEVYVRDHITKPKYSYWTLGYLISEEGAGKLLQTNPLGKMLPVDEFLPIMFDEHPNDTWKRYFPNRNLNAFSAAPLLVYPTHYTGQEGYVSDTEDSAIIDENSNDKTEL